MAKTKRMIVEASLMVIRDNHNGILSSSRRKFRLSGILVKTRLSNFSYDLPLKL